MPPQGNTDATKDRRRERNKVLARKTRCKKKAEFESLRKQLVKLQGENQKLKDMIQGTGNRPEVRARTPCCVRACAW